MVLAVLIILTLSSISIEKDFLILFRVIVVTVIEASIGLSLTVKQARYYNIELLKFFF